MNKAGFIVLWTLMLSGCVQTPQRPASGHLDKTELPANGAHLSQQIPQPVMQIPVVPEPTPAIAQESYSVVVTDVPLDELLFTLARDAKINIDVHPGLSGQVTLNAIDQSLLQILDRIASQVPIRYRFEDELVVVEPDQPYLRSYYIDYVNLTRSSSTSNSISTQIATTGGSAVADSSSGGGGGGGESNNSSTSVQSASENQFWPDLHANVASMLGLSGEDQNSDISVIVSSETGLLTVRATHTQHLHIQEYLDRMMASAGRQVLIEATVVEVELNDRYQFGVDWAALDDNGTGISLSQNLLGANLSSPPVFTIDALSTNSWGSISSTVKMLQEFGNVQVLSSPKIMAINNQTALLKVVDNVVYFTTEAETVLNNNQSQTSFTTTPHTVAVGFFMSVTPQISREEAVILSVRPTISRVTGFVNDPNPALAAEDIESRIPQIQVREMESVLRVRSGQIAVLGGLIQDTVDLKDQGLPGLSELNVVGDAFTYRNNQLKKSELVIFLRPRVVASIDQPFDVYNDMLPDPTLPMGPKRASDREGWN